MSWPAFWRGAEVPSSPHVLGGSMRQSVLALLLLSSTAAVAQERVAVVIELASPPAIESYLNAAAGKSSASSLRAAVTAVRNEIAVVDADQQIGRASCR